jgi:TPR repeat protein
VEPEKSKGFGSQKFISSLGEIPKGQQYCIEALCLLHGHGIEPDIEEAVRLLNKSAQLGESRAFFVLGEIQEHGIGCRVDKREALQFYQKAAQLGEPSAQLRLARIFLSEVNPRD